MAMNGFIENKKDATMLDVEQAFGSNLCRCTGYRPLMDCFKKFATDAPKEHRIMDIENLALCNKGCSKNGCGDEDDWCVVRSDEVHEGSMKSIILKDGKTWYRPATLTQVFEILQAKSSESDYMLVAGNTAKGGFPIDEYPNLLIDISHLEELKQCDFDQNLVIGAGNTLTQFLSILKEHSSQEYFKYLEKLYEHVLLVAHIPVRNVSAFIYTNTISAIVWMFDTQIRQHY
ncbi:uncharacterized protein LOC142977362 [Anticarsia gemmatalis]|uniref:uncharacterized protein LOC142977362 n=1 Tax=Anticarsia gemmatalis TaxID=129554 RepID=UPI003F77476E